MKKSILKYKGAIIGAAILVLTSACSGSSTSAPAAGDHAREEEYATATAADEGAWDGYDEVEYTDEMVEEEVYESESGVESLEITENAAASEDGDSTGGENAAEGESAAGGESSAEGNTASETKKRPRKLVTTVSIEAETNEMDALLKLVDDKIFLYNGYVEDSDIQVDHYSYGYGYQESDGYDYRVARMKLRVPAEHLEEFLDALSGNVNVRNISRSTKDITLQYVDVESHKKALEAEEESLREMVRYAETIEDIIFIQSRLTDVRYELEKMESQLRSFDNQADYSTVNLVVTEVVEYSPTPKEVKEQTVGDRIKEGFTDNLIRVGDALTDFFVGFIVSLPVLAVLAVVVIILVLIIRLIARKDKERREKRRLERAAVPGYGYPAQSSYTYVNTAQAGVKEKKRLFGRNKVQK